MNSLITKILIVSLVTLGLFAGLVYLTPQNKVQAATDANAQAVCEGAGVTNTSTGGAPATGCSGGLDLNNVIKFVLNTLTIIVGIAAVVMIIIGGFRFITSGGESNNVASAKKTILYAVIGLIIVAFAQIIVRFVLHKATRPPCPPGSSKISKPGDCI